MTAWEQVAKLGEHLRTAAPDEPGEQFVVMRYAVVLEQPAQCQPAAWLAVRDRPVEVEDRGPHGLALDPAQAVWVTLLRPRGRSGSSPSRRESASVSNCPGTMSPIGASHSGSAGPGSASVLAAASREPPPMA